MNKTNDLEHPVFRAVLDRVLTNPAQKAMASYIRYNKDIVRVYTKQGKLLHQTSIHYLGVD